MNYRIALLLAGLSAAGPSGAAVFCVATADELTAALAAAQLDAAASAEIRVHTGHYMAPPGGWHIDIDVRGITIAGGYDDVDCTSDALDAALTVLDGQHAVRPLTIDTSFVFPQTPTTHDIIVRGLTFANGMGDRVGGLKISDAGPIYQGSILVERNIFSNNAATTYQQDNSAGGLLAATDGPDFSGNVFLVVRDNLFTGNAAPDGAAAQLFSNNAIAVGNNTVVDNQSSEMSIAVRSAFATFTLTGISYSNNIFWNNNPAQLDNTFDLRADNVYRSTLAADLFDNDVQAVHGTPGTDQGNLAVDPVFIDALRDFRLAANSPLIDAGFDTPDGGLTTRDVAGADRVQGAHVDMGAYESAPEFIFRDSFE